MKLGLTLILFLGAALFSVHFASAENQTVYFGTYTKSGVSRGIYRAAFDSVRGTLSEPELAAELEDPSFVAFSPQGDRLYAVSESTARVIAYRIPESGSLEKINEQPSGGGAPCHASVSPDGKRLAVANYGAGSVSCYRIAKDGAISEPFTVQHQGHGPDAKRQKGPHAHSVNFSLDGRFLYAADLGTDKVYCYSADAQTGKLELLGTTEITPGGGPRHLTFTPDGKFAYVVQEMGLAVTAFSVDEKNGQLTTLQSISTLPKGVELTGTTAEILCHPSGYYLYASNRGHDSIAAYRIAADGRLSAVGNMPLHGKEPRGFALSPNGIWLIAGAQNSDTVAVYRIDAETGVPTFSGSEIKIGSPVCVRFVPTAVSKK